MLHSGMKIADREDALRAARRLAADGKLGDIADGLLEAYLGGIEQARSAFLQGKSSYDISKQLDERSAFIRSQISNGR
jgi:hypothetical protein